MLLITNGDAAQDAILRAGIRVGVLPWRDVLHDGPVPQNLSLRELSQRRALFLADCGRGDRGDIAKLFKERDDVLRSSDQYEEVLLWFEHDLYDQLQLLQLLDWFCSRNRGPQSRLTLICADEFISESPPERLCQQFEGRSSVTPEQLQVAQAGWKAFRSANPRNLLAYLGSDLSCLPFIQPAMIRFLEEYPSIRDGLTRTERQILEELRSGSCSVSVLYERTQKLEAARYLGDASFDRYLDGLASCPTPLIRIDKKMQAEASSGPLVHLLWTGREVLEGRADHIGLNGLNKWLGGVHLSKENVWRWDSGAQTLTR